MSPERQHPEPIRFRRVLVGTVDSTQVRARALLREGAESGTVVIAEAQSAGRGRGDHTWFSAAGLGLWLTVVHRSARRPSEWPIFTSAGAVAICMAIEETALDPEILWPNDVVIRGRKVCGILAETEGDVLLIGIGVNVGHRIHEFPRDLQGSATSLAIELAKRGRTAPERGAFLERALHCLATELARVEAEGPRGILAGVWRRSAVRGRRVEVRPDGSAATIRGEAVGLNEVGGLIVRGEAGTETVLSGSLLGIESEAP